MSPSSSEASFDDQALPPTPAAPPEPEDDFPRSSGRGRSGAPGRRRAEYGGPAFDDSRAGNSGFRQPPHDREAEQGVLGAMLLSPNTVLDIVEILTPDDFYHPAHALIYKAIIDLFAESKDIDPVIVAGRLDRQNELDRVGGAPYLHTLISSVPTAANARYYAEIVDEKATLRRLVEAGTRVVQLGYEGSEGAEVDAVVDMAQQEVFAINNDRSAEDYAVLADILQPTLDEMDEITANGGLAMGVPPASSTSTR